MTRALVLAAALFDRFRSSSRIWRNTDGTIDEAARVTPGQFARLSRFRLLLGERYP